MTSPRFYVQVDRPDGSRTFKGPLPAPRAEREAHAWNTADGDTGPWVATILPVAECREDFARWRKATRDGGRYYPEGVTR